MFTAHPTEPTRRTILVKQQKLARRLVVAVLVSVLIFVHELGHFVWAKVFGVKVLMFSIGFGPKLVRFRGRETEYCVGLLPLGGFVKMLEENRQEPVLPEDKHRTFEAQALWKRFIIVVAGPAMNILFPVLLYVGAFLGQTEFLPPTVGVVLPDHPADGKLRLVIEELLAIVNALAPFGQVHRGVLDDASRSPDSVLEDRLEAVGTRRVVESEIGEVEIGLPAVPGEVVPRLAHETLRIEHGLSWGRSRAQKPERLGEFETPWAV